MRLDFTYEAYEAVLEAAGDSDYRLLPVREYLRRANPPERFVILRHDVDRKIQNALEMARIEADHGMAATYYFRMTEETYDPSLISEVEALGHEVGYHYEDVDTAGGDLDAAVEAFTRNLERFRDHVSVDTVSMHGNPLTPYDNRDLWDVTTFEEHDLLGEVYLSIDFSAVVYYSDTNRTWQDERTIVNDWPVGPSTKPVEVSSTWDLIELIEARSLPRLYLLVHPNRWAGSPGEWAMELLKDTAINAGKWGLWAVRTARGREQRPGVDG